MMVRKEEAARLAVTETLRDLGFRAISEGAPANTGLRAKRGGQQWAVQIRAHAPFRREQFRGSLADAILELRAIRRERGKEIRPLLACWVDRATTGVIEEMKSYIDRHAATWSWLLVDSRGWRKWRVASESGDTTKRYEHAPGWYERARSQKPFAPRCQWVLKMMLLAGMDGRYWGGPSKAPSRLNDLADGVSLTHAFQCATALQGHDYVRIGEAGFEVPDVRALLDDWAAAVRSEREKQLIRVGPLYPSGDFDREASALVKRLAHYAERGGPGRAPVVGSHYACKLLKVSRSNVRFLRLYVDAPIESVLDRLDLVPRERADAIFEVVEARATESIFRGAVQRAGVSVCDALQCYLDARGSAARGEEQAELLFDTVLAPHFRERGWLS